MESIRFHVRKNDLVQVIAGKEKGKTGKVLKVLPKKNRVVVEKINFIKRHSRPSGKTRQGGIIQKEAPIHVSNVLPVCPKCNQGVRTGHRALEDGKKAARLPQVRRVDGTEVEGTSMANITRLKEIYLRDVAPEMKKKFGYQNIMEIPRLEKITLNMGLGEAVQNVKILDSAVEELSIVAGQKAVITKARRSIAAFKLREGMPIGVMVTLRRNRMYEFFRQAGERGPAPGARLPGGFGKGL